ncbi:hypothetical protein LYSHEL_11670 [Lysobacter helvus]|uniref:DUF4350 domain-containing protein n=2 Tax=Lysobacteraceae TaxID=32033 RepID=A0ABM7Q4A8_9GAMM|nr:MULTISPECIES: DUF4350 domain-containing protein [Lysobacter]BCT92143.1 hypothetical protein LYSCAS_11670 [Lysobacter caseinilyticus]BCT95296.1 hypothetical protein LYSHEL_11670 [Lysobacter helvus]
MNKRTTGFAALVALVLIVAIGMWWTATFERRPVDHWLPPKGEAATNPLYLLKVALQHDGQRVDARSRLALDKHPLGAHDTVVLLANPNTLSQREVARLLAFVQSGGHLLTPLAWGTRARAGRNVPLLGALGVRPKLDTFGCVSYWPQEHAHSNRTLCGRRFELVAPPVLGWHDDKEPGYAFARIAYGAGTVDVVTDADFLDNAGINGVFNAGFTRQLLAPNYGKGTFHLVYASDMPPLWRLLLDNAWRVLVPLALLLVGWLWMRAQRLGPRLPSAPEDRRALLEHVQASGEHLYRYGRGAVLHDALRRHVLARLRRRDPVAAALEGDDQVAAIAARTGLAPEDIAAALLTPRTLDAADFRARISRLIALRNRL